MGMGRGRPLGLFQVIGLEIAISFSCDGEGVEWEGGCEVGGWGEIDTGEGVTRECDWEAMVSIPALVWNRDILLTTQFEVCVRTVTSPP